MRARTQTFALAGMALIILAAPTLAADDPPPPPAGTAAATQAAAAVPRDEVPMAEFMLNNQAVRGRVVARTDDLLRVELPGRGTIGYPLDALTDLQEYIIPASAYYEEVGDLHHDAAWQTADPSFGLLRARQAYRMGLRTANPEAARRIEEKLELVAADREELHREALREEELRRAQAETETAIARKRLAEDALTLVETHGRAITELQDALGLMARNLDDFDREIQRMDRELEDLEDDLDRVYVTNRVFVQLRSAHNSLRRDVDRLSRELKKP